MKKIDSVGINAALNGFRIMLSVIFPLITYPYAARILGVVNLGIVNFSNSIISYFALLAGLGITTYAVREGSMIRDNHYELISFSNQIFTINIISSIIAYIFLVCFIIFIPELASYKVLMIVQSVVIFGNLLSVEWIFSIEEDYLYITIRSIVVHIVALILLFIFVHEESDFIWYAATTVIANVGASIFNFIHSYKYINLRVIKRTNILKHYKSIFIIFASSITATIYVNSDKTILGFLANTYSVGLYSVSVNVYSVSKAIFSAVMLAVLPRLSSYVSNNENQKFHSLSNWLAKYLFAFVVPAVLGIILTSKSIVILVGGQDFMESYLSLSILAVSLFFSVFSIFLTNAVLLPQKMESVNLQASIISAVINIVLNLMLLRSLKHNGAALTTLIAEMFMFFYEYSYAKKYLNISFNVRYFISILIGCFGIASTVFVVDYFISCFWLNIVFKMTLSIIVYFTIIYFLRNDVALDMRQRVKLLVCSYRK